MANFKIFSSPCSKISDLFQPKTTISIVSVKIITNSIVSVHRNNRIRNRGKSLAVPLVKGLRFAPIHSSAPLWRGQALDYSPCLKVRGVLLSPKTALFHFGGTGSRTPCNGSVKPVAEFLWGERYFFSVFAIPAGFEAK
jgi:hypothetical protein